MGSSTAASAALLLGGCQRDLVIVSEQPVDPREQQSASADDEARGDSAPEHVGLGEFPNRENRSDHRDHDARGDDPKRHGVDDVRIQKPAPHACGPIDVHVVKATTAP